MYIFIRFTAVAAILLGILLMLFGIAGSIYGFFQNDAFTTLVNEWLEASGDMRRVINAGFALLVLSAVSFVLGMVVSATGQLMFLFVDLAGCARETNTLLRSLRARPGPAVARKQYPPAEEENSNFY